MNAATKNIEPPPVPYDTLLHQALCELEDTSRSFTLEYDQDDCDCGSGGMWTLRSGGRASRGDCLLYLLQNECNRLHEIETKSYKDRQRKRRIALSKLSDDDRKALGIRDE